MKEKLSIYGQSFKSADILIYLPDQFRNKLSAGEKKHIKNAFYKAVWAYQKQEQENYLNRMLI